MKAMKMPGWSKLFVSIEKEKKTVRSTIHSHCNRYMKHKTTIVFASFACSKERGSKPYQHSWH